MNKKNNPLTKKDFEKTLYGALTDQAKSIIEAVDFGFEKAKEDRQEIKDKLSSLERRVIYIEDVITKHTNEIKGVKTILTKHSKELKEIKTGLKELKSQKEPLAEKVALLEKRVAQIEVKVG